MLFGCAKKSFYGFFSFTVKFFVSLCVPNIFAYFKVIFPDMLRNYFYMVLAFGTTSPKGLKTATILLPLEISIPTAFILKLLAFVFVTDDTNLYPLPIQSVF